ncbi:membrane hypothetical protein [Chitinispirillum alkaliphilum]|nr:membrane hypothetical protein [Chitinispirillum alkaliphilum]
MEMARENASMNHQQVDLKSWAKTGLIGGFIAAITFALFEMIVALILVDDFFSPLRMIGAIVLGPQALTLQIPLTTIIWTGTSIHIAYSLITGAIFASIISKFSFLRSTPAIIIGAGSAYGFLMWIINFYIIAPAAGWIWFPEQANQFWQGFVAHTFLFGAVLGWYVAKRKLHRISRERPSNT